MVKMAGAAVTPRGNSMAMMLLLFKSVHGAAGPPGPASPLPSQKRTDDGHQCFYSHIF